MQNAEHITQHLSKAVVLLHHVWNIPVHQLPTAQHFHVRETATHLREMTQTTTSSWSETPNRQHNTTVFMAREITQVHTTAS